MWLLQTVRRVLGQPDRCTMPTETAEAFEALNQQADEALDALRRRRERGLLNGALAPARPNGRHRP